MDHQWFSFLTKNINLIGGISCQLCCLDPFPTLNVVQPIKVFLRGWNRSFFTLARGTWKGREGKRRERQSESKLEKELEYEFPFFDQKERFRRRLLMNRPSDDDSKREIKGCSYLDRR